FYIILHAYASVINDIRHLLKQDWEVELNHILIEANQTADFLAKLEAKGHHSWSILEQPPAELDNGLLPDSMSILLRRL
ncbi:reverse transcriptase-like protein, partial [Escherichia coli]|uniref:reverse transcriptase-like protein n=1 Tax=Escherichia coli TaxID=562 RepID=UPI00128F58FC